MATDQKFGNVDIPGIPEGEPIFIIRAKDKASVDAIRDYASYAADAGASEEFLNAVDGRVEEFRKWQEENPDLVSVPD